MRWLLRHKKLIAVVIGILAIVAMAMWPEAIEVDLTQVTRGPMQVTLDEDGETRVRDRFVVSAPVAGRLLRVELEPGDAVVKGKTIVARLAPAAAPLLDPRTRSELDAGVAAAQGCRRSSAGGTRPRRHRADAGTDDARPAAGAEQGGRHLRRRSRSGGYGGDERRRKPRAPPSSRVTRSQHELELARARLTGPVLGGRATVDVVAPVRWRHPQAPARKRNGRPDERSDSRDRRSVEARNRRRLPVDRRRADHVQARQCSSSSGAEAKR